MGWKTEIDPILSIGFSKAQIYTRCSLSFQTFGWTSSWGAWSGKQAAEWALSLETSTFRKLIPVCRGKVLGPSLGGWECRPAPSVCCVDYMIIRHTNVEGAKACLIRMSNLLGFEKGVAPPPFCIISTLRGHYLTAIRNAKNLWNYAPCLTNLSTLAWRSSFANRIEYRSMPFL